MTESGHSDLLSVYMSSFAQIQYFKNTGMYFDQIRSQWSLNGTREYARGRRERRNRFRPADVAFFSSEGDKNVALIFRKIRCFNIHLNKHTCHQLVFDLGRSSTRYPSGLHKNSIRGREPVWEGS